MFILYCLPSFHHIGYRRLNCHDWQQTPLPGDPSWQHVFCFVFKPRLPLNFRFHYLTSWVLESCACAFRPTLKRRDFIARNFTSWAQWLSELSQWLWRLFLQKTRVRFLAPHGVSSPPQAIDTHVIHRQTFRQKTPHTKKFHFLIWPLPLFSDLLR